MLVLVLSPFSPPDRFCSPCSFLTLSGSRSGRIVRHLSRSLAIADVICRFVVPAVLRRRLPPAAAAALRLLRRGVAPAQSLQRPPIPSPLPAAPARGRAAGTPVAAAPGAGPRRPPGGADPLHGEPRDRMIQGFLLMAMCGV